jgi:hypothetical protein
VPVRIRQASASERSSEALLRVDPRPHRLSHLCGIATANVPEGGLEF